MKTALMLPDVYQSRYSLLTAFCQELKGAMEEAGYVVNPKPDPMRPTVYLFFNSINDTSELYKWMGPRRAPTAILNWWVDHIFNIHPPILDDLNKEPCFRLMTVAEDEMHLTNLRWPKMLQGRVWHGVPRSALCEAGGVEGSHEGAGRDIDVLVSGSILSDEEMAELEGRVPAPMRTAAREAAMLRLAHPWMSFGQSLDLVMPQGLVAGDHWVLLLLLFRYSSAVLNRERRVRLLRELQGLKVTVLGTESMRAHCTGTIRYEGQVPYGELPGWMARSKVCLAVNPTQFTHAFSERLLLGLAGGSACVSDDRLWVREQFGGGGANSAEGCVELFSSAEPGVMRARVEGLLGDPSRRAAMAARGRKLVEEKHLWVHRVPQIFKVAGFGNPPGVVSETKPFPVVAKVA